MSSSGPTAEGTAESGSRDASMARAPTFLGTASRSMESGGMAKESNGLEERTLFEPETSGTTFF